LSTDVWTDIGSCNIRIPHIPVGYAEIRVHKAGALRLHGRRRLGNAGAIAENAYNTKYFAKLRLFF